MNKLLTFFVGVLGLGGCTAMATAPVTMPIWLIVAYVFVVHRGLRDAWRLFSVLSLLQTLLIALFGLVAWYDLWQRGYVSSKQVNNTFFLFLLPALSAVAITITLALARTELDDSERGLVLVLQLVATVLTLAPVWFMLSHR